MAMVVQYLSELGRLAGGGAALVFAVALLASGVSSSSVGTHAGEASWPDSSGSGSRCWPAGRSP
jgi:Mn2+/Fe2+ NRAMP family transporter